MKIRLLTSLSGPDGAYSAGDEYECPSEEAQRHVVAGNAEFIRGSKAEKTAKAPAPENTSKGTKSTASRKAKAKPSGSVASKIKGLVKGSKSEKATK